MSGKYGRILSALGMFAAAVTAGLLVAQDTNASAGPKSYTAVATKAKLQSGSQTAGITFANTSRNKISFNAINIAVPTGLTVSNPATLVPTLGSATVTPDGSTIQLRDLNVPQGASLTVSFTVAATLQPVCQSYTFVSDVRQSNDFNGQNNKFALDGTDASVTGPCSSGSVTCVAGDSQDCAISVESANGNTASIFVNDGNGISAILTASVATGSLTCTGYPSTSDQLQFDISKPTVGTTAGVTKTVTFTQHYDVTATPPLKQAWEYQACFQAPYDFPALLPLQLAHDFATHDFSGNTAGGPTGPFTGLLLPCSAGYGFPCLASTAISLGGTGNADDTVSITVTVPAADPAMRF